MSDDVILKPCPFCGGEAQIENDYKDFDAFVSCLSCGARGEVFNLDSFSDCEDARMSDVRMFAVQAWNKRYKMTENLKPCPFCGSRAHNKRHEHNGKILGVACDNCEAFMPTADAWNRRVDS